MRLIADIGIASHEMVLQHPAAFGRAMAKGPIDQAIVDHLLRNAKMGMCIQQLRPHSDAADQVQRSPSHLAAGDP
jgi:hypothetical protein